LVEKELEKEREIDREIEREIAKLLLPPIEQIKVRRKKQKVV